MQRIGCFHSLYSDVDFGVVTHLLLLRDAPRALREVVRGDGAHGPVEGMERRQPVDYEGGHDKVRTTDDG